MKVLIFGATGTIGQRILREAVARGHQVTAASRDVSRIKQEAGMRAVRADLLDPAQVASAVQSHDAVVSAYGPGPHNPALLLNATRALIQGVSHSGVKRLIVVGGAGSLKVAAGVELVDTPQFPPAWKGIAQAHREALHIYELEAPELEWTYVSPSALIEPAERTGKFRIGTDRLLTDAQGESRISAEDFAVAVIDELEHPQHVRQRFTVGY